jgi:hypothetical protein
VGPGRQAIAIAVVASLLVAGCGSDTPEGSFDPSTAEEFVRNKARADVSSNPALLVAQPKDPSVTCDQAAPGESESEETARFRCHVRIVDEEDAPLGRQTWIAEVEIDAATGDTIVRSSKRIESTITPAPSPLESSGRG